MQKLESGKLQLRFDPEVISCRVCIKYLSESFYSLAESKGINLVFHAGEEELWMDFDPEKILRIYTNLLSNAIKFTPKGGNIKVHLSKVDGANMMIKVSDSGIGISEEDLPNIFDRFYQIYDHHSNTESSRVKDGEGTGIGLALIKELVQLMEGKIEVESSLGKGTSFTLKLPITNKAAKEETKIPDHRPTSSPKIVVSPSISSSRVENLPSLLIIEDNPDISEYLISCLEDQYMFLTAANGQEGIDIALEQIPDLIISDVMMPKKDGYEVCDTLKNDNRTSHIPIVLLTAKSDQDSRIQGLKRGADAYLAKPFHKDELLIRLEMLLENRRKLRARYANHDFQSSDKKDSNNYEDQFFTLIYKVIDDNLFDSDFNVPALCEAIGMSRTSLHRKVKALTGKSVSLFMRSYRLSKGKKLLLNSSLTVAEIAYNTGFNDPGHFSKSFSQEYGVSPKVMRKESL